MLLDDDVVAHREPKAGAFAGRLGREKRVEHLFFHVGRHTGAVVTDPDFHTITKVFGRSHNGRLIVAGGCCRTTLARRIEAV